MRIRTQSDSAPNQARDANPPTASKPPDDGNSRVDLNRIGESAFFRRLIQTNDPDLPYYGLNHLTSRGVDMIADWARTHDAITGNDSGSGRIGSEARAIMGALLEDQVYPSWFAQGTIPKIRKVFDLKQTPIQGPLPGEHLQAPDVRAPIPENVSKHTAADLAARRVRELPALLAAELSERKADLARAPVASARTPCGGALALGLLKSYTDALWAKGQHAVVEQVGHELLDTLERFTLGSQVAFEDFNGAGWSAAQSLVLGLDPNAFPRHFPDAIPREEFTYLYFGGKLAEPMGYVDAYLAAMGKKTGAKHFEQQSMLGFMIGQPSGHTKAADDLDEQRPFATSGLNWGVLLFPGDQEIAELPPLEGFEFPIDCLSSTENLVVSSAAGNTLRPQDRSGQPLTAEKIIHKNREGAPESWSARFLDASGQEIPPEEVIGRIWTSKGWVLGDGRVDLKKDLKWWGFCDINAAQRLYKTKYGMPQIDREIVPVRANGTIIEVPRDDAQRLFDCALSDLPSRESHCGFRFDERPVILKLKNGGRAEGRIEGLDLVNTRTSRRLDKDRIDVPNTPRRTTLGPVARDGQLAVEQAGGRVQNVDLDDVESVIGSTEDDVRPSQYMAWVSRHGGVFATDSAVGAPVSNGIRWVNQIDIEARKDSETPAWAQRQLHGRPLKGLQGEVVRERGDKMLWVRGLYGGREQVEERRAGDPEKLNIQFGGWIQVNRQGRIINEGFISGQPDFGWNGEGALDWSRRSYFNPFMEPDFRLQLLVNGLKDRSQVEAVAERLDLPANWRDLRIEDAELAGDQKSKNAPVT